MMHLQTLLTCDVCGARVEWAAPIVMHGPGHWVPGFAFECLPVHWTLTPEVLRPLRAHCSNACREKHGIVNTFT